MEIVIYVVVVYLIGMFLSSTIVQFMDPYGFYIEDTLFTVFWPIMFPFWIIFRVADLINNLIFRILP